jgi:hypothetical protein
VAVEIIAGREKSEFAVFVDDAPVFSRLQQRRYPELDELLAICRRGTTS